MYQAHTILTRLMCALNNKEFSLPYQELLPRLVDVDKAEERLNDARNDFWQIANL